jgi:hypothetical protein
LRCASSGKGCVAPEKLYIHIYDVITWKFFLKLFKPNYCRGTVNQTRPLLTNGGKQARLGMQVLEKCLDEVQNLENINPNQMAPKAHKKLGQVCQDMSAGLSGVDLGTDKLLRCSGMQYSKKKRVRETMTPRRGPDGSYNLLSALEACDECNKSRSRLSSGKNSDFFHTQKGMK